RSAAGLGGFLNSSSNIPGQAQVASITTAPRNEIDHAKSELLPHLYQLGYGSVGELFFQRHPGTVAVRENLIDFRAASFLNAINDSHSVKSSCGHANRFRTGNVSCYTAESRARIKDLEREFASSDKIL